MRKNTNKKGNSLKYFYFQPSWLRTKEFWDKSFEDRYEKIHNDTRRPRLKVGKNLYIINIIRVTIFIDFFTRHIRNYAYCLFNVRNARSDYFPGAPIILLRSYIFVNDHR